MACPPARWTRGQRRATMMAFSRSAEGCMRSSILVWVLSPGRLFITPPAAQAPAVDGARDFTPFVEFAQLLPPRVEPHKDEKTGFIVGGKNPTALLGKLTEINGRSIAQLEADMRPKKLSGAGFMGP